MGWRDFLRGLLFLPPVPRVEMMRNLPQPTNGTVEIAPCDCRYGKPDYGDVGDYLEDFDGPYMPPQIHCRHCERRIFGRSIHDAVANWNARMDELVRLRRANEPPRDGVYR